MVNDCEPKSMLMCFENFVVHLGDGLLIHGVTALQMPMVSDTERRLMWGVLFQILGGFEFVLQNI